MSIQQIKTNELDFATIKDNLKYFLASQPNFSDYDFDGSVISTLLDLLAYNTHYNALYTNLAINEAFIDSASKRASLVSIAKLMGYTPKSVTSSKAVVNIAVATPNSNLYTALTLSKGTKFVANVENTAYTFNISEDVTSTRQNLGDEFLFENVPLIEGIETSITYTAGTGVKFVVPETKADSATISVNVFSPVLGTTTKYHFANSVIGTEANEKIFFIKQRDDLFYEVYFGDGLFGASVEPGSVVTLTYMISEGELANRAASFAYSSGAEPNNSYTVTTVMASSGGAPEESKDSIRYYAPLAHQAQGRVVTSNDYGVALVNENPDIETINVWGGQDNVPPIYGKVFIAAKPFGRDNFTTLEKEKMARGLVAKKNVITVTPVFVDPKFLDVEVISNVYYNPTKLVKSPGELATNVTEAIQEYGSTLSVFGQSFRHSYLSGKIDKTDVAIVSNITNIRVRQEVFVFSNIANNYHVIFGNPIAKADTPTFYSTRFFTYGITGRCFLSNTGNVIKLYRETTDGVPIYVRDCGTMDYSGSVKVDGLIVIGLYDPKFEFVFYPKSYDVIPLNNYIVRLLNNKILVNVLADSLSQTRSAKTTHIFSASR